MRRWTRGKTRLTATMWSRKEPETLRCGPDGSGAYDRLLRRTEDMELLGNVQRPTCDAAEVHWTSRARAGEQRRATPITPDSRRSGGEVLQRAVHPRGKGSTLSCMSVPFTWHRCEEHVGIVRGLPKLCQSRSKTPWALSVWNAVACRLIAKQQLRFSRQLMLMVTCYLPIKERLCSRRRTSCLLHCWWSDAG